MTDTIDLFVYGTLRTGQPLSSWLDGCTVWTEPACIEGRLYPAHSRQYPVAKLSEPGLIHGEIRVCETGPQLDTCIDMEIRSGYVAQEVTVLTELGDETGRTALAFHYLYRPPTSICISSGDWAQWAKENL